MNNTITQELISKLPARRKYLSTGWVSFNCPCCVPAGQARPDTRSRGGIIFDQNGGFQFNCFNCKTRVTWRPGHTFSSRVKFFFHCMGFNQSEIKKLSFDSWRLSESMTPEEKGIDKVDLQLKNIEFDEIDLPKGSKTFDEWLTKDNVSSDCLEAMEYVANRGPGIIESYEYYWSPIKEHQMNHRVIIPFYWRNGIVGYTARLIKGKGDRYWGHKPNNYLFKNDNLVKSYRKYALIMEGSFDAIAVDGVGVLGSTLNADQINWINSSGLSPIIVPDRNDAGQALIDVALDQKWAVSFPLWSSEIDDVSAAAKKYGRLWTLKSIFDGVVESAVAINVRRRMFK